MNPVTGLEVDWGLSIGLHGIDCASLPVGPRISEASIILEQSNHAEPRLERFSSSADNSPLRDPITHHCTDLKHPVVGLNIAHGPRRFVRKVLTKHPVQPNNFSTRKWTNLSKYSRINAPNQTIPSLSTTWGSPSTKFWHQLKSLTSPSLVCNLYIYLHSSSLHHLHRRPNMAIHTHRQLHQIYIHLHTNKGNRNHNINQTTRTLLHITINHINTTNTQRPCHLSRPNPQSAP